ncbi:hypothetical protein [Paenibacillus timonensis]|uniref:hypothetical protein n=1 Tax=Paenibacillus timonensis TaxID=225915 RepID=UPI003F99C312
MGWKIKGLRQGGISIRKSLWVTATAGLALLAAIYTWWYIENVSPVKMTKTLEGVAWLEEDPKYSPPIRISLDGYYDQGDDQFRGTIRINGQVYPDCYLASGYLVSRYEGETLIRLGQIYYDEGMGRLVWLMPQSDLPPELTNPQYSEAEVLLAAPATSGEEALELLAKLKKGQKPS